MKISYILTSDKKLHESQKLYIGPFSSNEPNEHNMPSLQNAS